MTGYLLSFCEILVIAALFTHNNVVAEIDLNGPINEVQVTSWFLIAAQFPWAVVDLVDDMFALVGFDFARAEVVLIKLIVDSRIVTLGFTFIPDFFFGSPAFLKLS